MVAELDSIPDPSERRRFAAGAIAAIVRLALSGYGETVGRTAETGNKPPQRDPSMSTVPTYQLLRRLFAPFAVTFTLLTALMLANVGANVLPQLSARGASAGTIAEALLLALPATMGLTIPMAVFVAVSWVFARLGREGVLTAAQRQRHGVRRLVGPVLGAAALVAGLMFVSNTQILPRVNGRLGAVLVGNPMRPNERSMTIGELRDAARSALAAACLVLALAGATIPLRFPRGGLALMVGAGGAVFTGYYVSLVAGEALADQRVISPLVAMWMANALLLAVILLLAWRPGGPEAASAAA